LLWARVQLLQSLLDAHPARNAEPTCDACGQVAVHEIRVDGEVAYRLCAECRG
jgi:hypothetical protein